MWPSNRCVSISFVLRAAAQMAANNLHDTTIYGAIDNYLHEASQANDPPSGTYYAPNGDSVRLQSLGVHEHWNNSTDREYSRNLGTGNGIELVKLKSTTTSVPEGKSSDGLCISTELSKPIQPFDNDQVRCCDKKPSPVVDLQCAWPKGCRIGKRRNEHGKL